MAGSVLRGRSEHGVCDKHRRPELMGTFCCGGGRARHLMASTVTRSVFRTGSAKHWKLLKKKKKIPRSHFFGQQFPNHCCRCGWVKLCRYRTFLFFQMLFIIKAARPSLLINLPSWAQLNATYRSLITAVFSDFGQCNREIRCFHGSRGERPWKIVEISKIL